MSELAPLLRQWHPGPNGSPLAGGKLYSYVAGSLVPLATYTDQSGDTANTNPVVLDSDGYASVWIGDGSYKFVLTDSDGATIWTVDDVKSLSAQIAEQLNIAGALAASNNLSDLTSVSDALVNLDISPFNFQNEHAITASQSATTLVNESFDGDDISSVIYEFEIIQSTTVQATGKIALHYLNGTWVKYEGEGLGTAHGIEFSLSQSTTVVQLKAAETLDLDGTLKLKRHVFYA